MPIHGFILIQYCAFQMATVDNLKSCVFFPTSPALKERPISRVPISDLQPQVEETLEGVGTPTTGPGKSVWGF